MLDLHAQGECQSLRLRLHATMCAACSLSFPYLYKEGRRRLDIERVGEYNGAMSPPERRHELLSWFWSSSAKCHVSSHQLYARKLNATRYTKHGKKMCHFHNSWLQNIHYNPQSSNKSTRAADLHIKIYAVNQCCVLRGLDKPDTGHWTSGHLRFLSIRHRSGSQPCTATACAALLTE